MQASGVLPVPPLARATTALLCVDLQPCYYTPPLATHFPHIEEVISKHHNWF